MKFVKMFKKWSKNRVLYISTRVMHFKGCGLCDFIKKPGFEKNFDFRVQKFRVFGLKIEADALHTTDFYMSALRGCG